MVIPTCRPGEEGLRWPGKANTARKSQSRAAHAGLSGCQALAAAALWVLQGMHTYGCLQCVQPFCPDINLTVWPWEGEEWNEI